MSSSPGGPVYVWDLIGDRGRWDPAKAEGVWADLASPDAAAAFAAIRALRADPSAAVTFLKGRVRLRAVPTDEAVGDLVRGLDAPTFGGRERAVRELAAVADLIRPKLTAARQGASEEVRRRLDRVLKGADELTAERLRHVRACEVLEGLGTPEALRVLGEWAAGPPGVRLTVEAARSAARRKPVPSE